ncbi:hypothetical protein PTSG_05344 [Salpingoeca rosetta]|uniref:EF-hand domain-containing protein n=1 Tax=Salpingoeca rosetta (strain ATCC 50818 / BSB-021) TaxID=946362 RepID=F2UA61_SALR5|nr:uncharacterized protein PTSG_05344 [Salpingoeca rosetta]EGD73636.1 hypothetical protein PTSG_05344 [Salpingoeca rosetta]|eukprot:XP_004993917.1 hypothetical protein PTSG_05344 [Salpingoeca rosetta]
MSSRKGARTVVEEEDDDGQEEDEVEEEWLEEDEIETEGARRFHGQGRTPAGVSDSGDTSLDFRFLAGPLSTTFSVGTLTGACAASAVKKVGRMSAGFIGAGFLALQLLAYKGYVTVHWDKIEHDVTSILDRDGDGKVSQADLQYWQHQLAKMATFQLPASMAGFGVGFGLGLKYL